MIEIEAPDGSVVEFPDGTGDDVIKSVMRKNFSQQPTPVPESVTPKDQPARFEVAQGDVFNAMQGATFGFGDELAAGSTALMSKLGLIDKGISYDKALEILRGANKTFGEEHPVRAVASNVAGAIPTMIAAAPVAAAAMPARLAAATGIGGRMLQAGASGLGYGSIAGFGGGEGGFGNRLESGAEGAAIGAATGTILQGGAEIAKPLLRATGKLGSVVKDASGFGTPENMANRAILEASKRAGITPEQMLAQIKESQVPLSLADVGGDPMQQLSRAVVTQSGPGSSTAIKALTERQAGRGDRLINTFRDYVSPMDDATQTIDELVKFRASQGRPDYEAAMSLRPATSENIQRMLRDPIMQRGLARGRDIQRIEASARGTKFEPNDYILSERVTGRTAPTYSERSAGVTPQNISETVSNAVPNMRVLQSAKIGLDDILEGYRDKVTGRLVLDQKGRAINELRANFVKELESVNPDFATANRNWGDTTSLMNSVNRGRDFLRGDVDMTERAIKELTPAEKSMFRVGAARELRRLVETTRGDNNALRKFFGSTEQTRRLRALFDSDEQFASFKKVLEDEQLAQKTENYMLGGSQTANKEQGLNLLGSAEVPATKTGIIANILRGTGNAIVGGARTRRAEELAPILYGNNTQKLAERIMQLQGSANAQQQKAANLGLSGDRLRNALAAALAQ